MRRVLAALVVLGAIAAGLALSGAGGTSGGYRIDAIFDNASFLIPGQDVKIAGARVGKVVGVKLTPDNKARIQMEIDPHFTPFRSDADCTIQPQSLIGEKFIQCTPGTPRGRPLTRQGDTPPTVPLSDTHAPVDIDLVLSTFRRPTNERLGILLSELGAGLAARGDDLNDAIRRANPALQETNRVLQIVDSDRSRLQALIHASGTVLVRLAASRGKVTRFISSAGKVAATTGRRNRELAATVQGLPALLRQAQPSLESLRSLARDGTPVLRDLRASAEPVTRLARAVGPLSDAAKVAIPRVGEAAKTGAPILKKAKPIIADLRTDTALLNPISTTASDLLQSLRDTGTVEGLQDFAYNGALVTSRFDRYSHLITPYIMFNACSLYATATTQDCDAHFATGAVAARRKAKARHQATAHVPKTKAAPQAPVAPAQPPAAAPEPAQPQQPSGGHQIKLPGLPPITLPDLGLKPKDGDKGDTVVKDLLDFLLK